MENKLKSKTSALLICFLLTSISFASDVVIRNTEKEEAAILSAINNDISKLNSNSVTGDIITARAAKIKSVIDNDNKKMGNAKTAAKIFPASKDYPEVKTKNEITAVKNTIAKNPVVENTGIKIVADNADNKKPDVSPGIKETPFTDNEQVKVILSNRDINRILVKGDKIQSVNGPTGLYTAKNDASGSAYISLYGDARFTIFISTVNGHNFSLLISPKLTAGRTIILEPTSPSLLPAHFEETESYQKVLVTLISNMINNEALEDYSYTQTKKPKSTDFYGMADIRQIISYSGSHLLGSVSEIKNKSRKPIILKPSYFYKPGVRAAALSKQTIAPHETGLLYQVISIDQKN